MISDDPRPRWSQIAQMIPDDPRTYQIILDEMISDDPKPKSSQSSQPGDPSKECWWICWYVQPMNETHMSVWSSVDWLHASQLDLKCYRGFQWGFGGDVFTFCLRLILVRMFSCFNVRANKFHCFTWWEELQRFVAKFASSIKYYTCIITSRKDQLWKIEIIKS